MNYYQRLKDLREDHDLTQEQAGKILKIKQSYYGKYERGEIMMGIDKYIKLAQYYNVSLDYITGIIDTPEPLIRQTNNQQDNKESKLISAFSEAPQYIQEAICKLLHI